MPDHHQTQIRALRAQARATHQRRLLLLEGEANWTLATAQTLVAALLAETPLRRSSPPDPCWIGRGPAKQALSARQVLGLLGGERELIIYDLFSGLDPDALAAAAGTLRGGGLLILLGPPLSAWSDFVDPAAERIATHPYPPEAVGRRFLTRMAALLETAPGSARILEQAPIRPGRSSPAALNAPIPHSAPQGWSLTPGQQQVLAAIAQLMTERDPRPLVVSAGRGRGKSTALGLAARTLSHHGSHRILVTAPRYRAACTLLEQAQASETAPGQAAIHFQPPDQIAYAKPAADLLLIDEAAAIPAPLLRQLLEAYRRVVFATTIHGYEGTGRGFALRFFALLDARTPGWRHLELQQPLRYAAEDPLEALIDRLLLLDAEPADAARLDANAGQPVRIQPCDRQRLSQQEEGLGALFGLLRLAHYQTRPSDLRHLLDGPNLSIIGLSRSEPLLAAALIAQEGALDEALSAAIFAGTRRPRGHLLPQTLSAHAGLAQAPRLKYARIVRIAVHPRMQRQGYGRALLESLITQDDQNSCDLIGASFGATASLVAFWRVCGFIPVHLGRRCNAATGVRAAVVLHALSPAGQQLLSEARARFCERLLWLLPGQLSSLEPALVVELLRANRFDPSDTATPRPIPASIAAELHGFAQHQRSLEAALPVLARLAPQPLGRAITQGTLDSAQAECFIAVVLQQHPPEEIAPRWGYSGRAALIAQLRTITLLLLKKLA